MACLSYALSYMSQLDELLTLGASAEQEGQLHSVLDCDGVSLSLQKQSCLSPDVERTSSDLETKMFFP